MSNLQSIQKPAIEIILDGINIANAKKLFTDSSVFSQLITWTDPVDATVNGSDDNTMITITATDASPYTGSRDIYYYREDINNILSTKKAPISVGSASTLYGIIDNLNEVFGVYFTQDDLVNVAIPAYPGAGEPWIITIAAKSTSLLFKGSCSYDLNGQTIFADTDGYYREYFILSKDYDSTNYKKQVTRVTTNDDIVTNYSFCGNATTVRTCTTKDILWVDGVGLYSFGQYDMDIVSRDGFSTASTITGTVLLTDANGYIISCDSTSFNGGSSTIVSDKSQKYFYSIDTTSNVVKYTSTGAIDTSFSCALTATPTVISVDTDGSVFSVSPLFSAVYQDSGTPIVQYTIDKLTSSGSRDTTFRQVTCTGNGNAQPITVVCLTPTGDNGVWVLFNPVYGASSTSANVKINNSALCDTASTTDFTFNPVVRILPNGVWDTTFVNNQTHYSSTAFYKPQGSTLGVGQNAIKALGTGVVFLSHKTNPITGYDHRQVLVFDSMGNPQWNNGVDYISAIRWSDAKTVLVQSNGEIIVYGSGIPFKNNAWSTPLPMLASYYSDGTLNTILYINTSSQTTSGSVIIDKVVLREILYTA